MQTKQLYSYLLIGLMAALGLSSTTYANDKDQKGAKNYAVSGSYTVIGGYKPIYFEDPGSRLDQTLALHADVHKNLQLSAQAGLVSIQNPEKVTYQKDLSFSAAVPEVIATNGFKVAASMGFAFAQHLPHKQQLLRYRSNIGLVESQKLGLFSVGHRITFDEFFYKYTLDEFGNANPRHQLTNTLFLGAELFADFTAILSASAVTRYDYYKNREDLWATGLDLSYALTKALTTLAGVATSTAQIRNDAVERPKLFDKDVSEAYTGLSFAF